MIRKLIWEIKWSLNSEETGVFGILADMDFIIICTYEKDGENPELLIYKKR